MVRTTAQGCDNRVRPARVSAGLTQAQLAQAAGVSRQTVVAVEAGDYAPSVYLALRLAQVLGDTVERLFTPTTRTAGPEGGRPAPGSRTGPEED